MHFQKWGILAFSGAMLGGCAIHPVQQDVTRVPTPEIVHQIRCETRFAILEKAARLLENEPFNHIAEGELPLPSEIKRVSQLAAEIRQLGAGPLNVSDIYIKLDNDRERSFFKRYIETAVAYIFTFDIFEQNVVGFRANPVQALTYGLGGLAGLQIGASADFKRSNSRTFAILESFEETLVDPNLRCPNYQPVANLAYPISGAIGMYSVIEAFIDVNQARPLGGGAVEVKMLDGKAPVLADTLEFTTVLSADITPSITLKAAGTQTGLSDQTNFAPTIKRSDRHQVIIGLALAELRSKSAPVKGPRKPILGNEKKEPKGFVRNETLFKIPFNLPQANILPLAPSRKQQQPPAQTAGERAIGAARDQLLLNFYNRTVR